MESVRKEAVSIQTIKRLPLYISYLKSLPKEAENVSATGIAADMALGDVQVRKDLAAVCSGGRPKTGYNRKKLIADIEAFLGHRNANTAVLVGMGNMGRALHDYSGFREYGLDIAVAFDIDENVVGKVYSGKRVMHVSKLKDLCERLHVNIGIITVPAENAREVCDTLVEAGVKAIWNFAPVYLSAPQDVLVQNETIISSLAILSNHLKQNGTMR